MLRSPLAPAPLAALDAWVAAGRALVARRRDDGTSDACLALALPLAAGRARIGCVVDGRAIASIAPPLTLTETIGSAPLAWRAALADLQDAADRIDTTFHVYGSHAWQAITGEPCVRPDSDIDLAWTAASLDRVAGVLAMLAAWEARHALRADGELLLANGDAVAWRELTRPVDRVLVKYQDGVSLQSWPAHWHASSRAATPA